MIPFIHPLEYDLLSTPTINKAYELAPAAGPALVNIGYRLSNTNARDLEDIQAHIKDVLPNLDSRGVMEYTVLMGSALQVNKTSHIGKLEVHKYMIKFVLNCCIAHAYSITLLCVHGIAHVHAGDTRY